MRSWQGRRRPSGAPGGGGGESGGLAAEGEALRRAVEEERGARTAAELKGDPRAPGRQGSREGLAGAR